MKRILIFSSIFLFLITTPVLAQKSNSNRANKAVTAKVEAEVSPSPSPSATLFPLASPSAVPASVCDPEGDYKNHGQYVSCVAKLKQGGVAVSAAAQSDISKLASESLLGKKSEAGPAPVASATPSGSPSASPSPSVSPSGSPAGISKLASESLLGTTGAGVESAKIEIGALIEVLQNIIRSLQNLMTN